jgi:transcriptional regulator with XRE-family HTH domain
LGFTGEAVMSVVLNRAQLRLEIAQRGWTASQLAREAGLSPATLSAALAGRAVAAASLKRIAEALARAPAIDGIERLIGSSPERTVE